jgi:ParB family chromosome partitioning protein
MPRKHGLGRGLDALLPSDDAPTTEVAIGEIALPDAQPRQKFAEGPLRDLAASIRQHGVLQPLVVSRQDSGYVLIAGERRLRASKLAGLRTVPVHVRTGAQQDRFELALLENLQRENLSPLEEARAYRTLLAETNLTQEALSERLGVNRSQIAGSIRLLTLPADIAIALEERKISTGHAKILAGKEGAEQRQLFDAIVAKGLTVRQAEVFRTGSRPATKSQEAPAWLRQLEQSLGTQVSRSGSDRRGKLQIHYHSTEQLNELLEKFLSED